MTMSCFFKMSSVIVSIIVACKILSIFALDVKCDQTISHTNKPMLLDDNKYGLWPGLINTQDLSNGQTLFGMNEAMEKIWQNQNPPDCSKAKYLISTGWYQGFGSEVHFHGAVLALALDTGRVLLQEGGWTWRYRNEHCDKQGKKNMRCYMLPYSKCTMKDAMGTMMAGDNIVDKSPSHGSTSTNAATVAEWTSSEDKILQDAVLKYGKKGHWSQISSLLEKKTDLQCYERWNSHTEPTLRNNKQNPPHIKKVLDSHDPTMVDYISQHKVVAINRVVTLSMSANKTATFNIKHKDTIRDNVVMIDDEIISLKYGKYVPNVLADLVYCAKLQKGFEYMWWRAISATFMLRPNKETLALIEKHRDPILKASGGNCVSTYIRHGDKTFREMKFVDFKQYADAASVVFRDNKHIGSGTTASSEKILYVATEDPKIIPTAYTWGKNNNVNVRISNFTHQILSDHKQFMKPHDLEKSLPKNREMEYFSYLLHLAEQIRCNVNICTIPSNFCRLVDELKGTVGGKANKLNVDMSTETCEKVPCFREFGFANHPGSVYDPKTRIW